MYLPQLHAALPFDASYRSDRQFRPGMRNCHTARPSWVLELHVTAFLIDHEEARDFQRLDNFAAVHLIHTRVYVKDRRIR